MRTLVIGEVGNNHKTDEDILESIAFLRKRGCLIKFQAHQGEFAHLKDYVISKETMKAIRARDVFYSVFSLEMLDWLEKNIEPLYYKIASRSLDDFELISRAQATSKTVFQSIPFGKKPNTPLIQTWNTTYLHCVSEYPAFCSHLNIMKRGVFEGLSDHTTSTFVPALAVACGAKIIEKHFSIREMDSPDRPHSLLPDQWDEMLQRISEAEYQMAG